MSWVRRRFGVDGRRTLDGLVELALRRNPKRAHLLVSTVLGKHVPTDPRVVHDAGLRLGRAVAQRSTVEPALVIGFAETATGLGHCVAEALDAPYLHSTRRVVDRCAPAAASRRSTATRPGTCCCPRTRRCSPVPGPLVLVDDELSTGAHRAEHDRRAAAAARARAVRDRRAGRPALGRRPARRWPARADELGARDRRRRARAGHGAAGRPDFPRRAAEFVAGARAADAPDRRSAAGDRRCATGVAGRRARRRPARLRAGRPARAGRRRGARRRRVVDAAPGRGCSCSAPRS